MTLRNSNQFFQPIDYHPINDYVSHQQEKSPSLLCSRFKKMEQPLPFTKKAKSYKKHFFNNLHDASNLKYLGTTQEKPRFQSCHDKLNVRDISGATPDYFRNQIFKNRLYGKKIDRQQIFDNNNTLLDKSKEEKNNNNVILPKITQESSPREFKLRSDGRDTIQPHPMKLNIDHEVLKLNIMQEKQHKTPSVLPLQRRRIKTQLDNPENYFRQYHHSPSKELRKWNPTYLTDASNPLLAFLPKIK